jgi:hypothetical protein
MDGDTQAVMLGLLVIILTCTTVLAGVELIGRFQP